MSQEVKDQWSVCGLQPILINGVYVGVITQLLTIDPNFLGHPSRVLSLGIPIVFVWQDLHKALSFPSGTRGRKAGGSPEMVAIVRDSTLKITQKFRSRN